MLIRPFIIRIMFFLPVCLMFSGCCLSPMYSNADSRTLPKPIELPTSVFSSKSPEDWAQLQITEHMTVLSFDDYRVNWWGFKEQHFIPTGRHKIVFLPSGYQNAGTIEYSFLPGQFYVLRTTDHTSETSTSGNVTTTRRTARPEILEHGVTEFAVPKTNQSIVDFILEGERAMVHIDRKHYVLTTLESRESSKLRLFLPNGNYTFSVSSLELFRESKSTGDQSLNLQNQHVSYVITSSYQLRLVTQSAKQTGGEASKMRLGELIGVIGGFEGGDVVVNGKDTIGVQAPIGRALIVDVNGQYIYLQSTFPMQTVVKCKVINGERAQIKKGMKVYLKP